MSCPTSVFSNNSNINYDSVLNWNNTNEKCMSIGFDNSLTTKSSMPYEIKEISCEAIKPNSKLIVYTYKNSSNDIIPCPLGGWCNNNNNQKLLNLGINSNQINKDFKLYTIDGVSNIDISNLCIVNNAPTVSESPVQPPVEPPVESPVQPPVEPPVEPPVQPPVEPPVEPPVQPPVQPPVEPSGQNNCSLNYFNNSLNNGSLDCNAINRENLFISQICINRTPGDNTSFCENTEMNLSLDTTQTLVFTPINCSQEKIVQTYLLKINDTGDENNITLPCPIGGFCDNENNRSNLKKYMKNEIQEDPRCNV
jgi:hypothetical protein